MQAHTYQSARLQARSALAFAMCLDQPGVGLADTVALHFKSATDVGPWCSLSPGSDHKIPDKTLFRGWVALVALAPWLSTSSGTHTRKTFQGPGRERQQASHGAPSVRARAFSSATWGSQKSLRTSPGWLSREAPRLPRTRPFFATIST